MRITLVTPAARGSKSGNRATAERWARHLRALGHRPSIITEYAGEPTDLMIALHAWRSADAVRRVREYHPDTPLIVALTGTDIYRFQQTHPEETCYSMRQADALIGLHDRVGDDIPGDLHAKLFTVFQSAEPLPQRQRPIRSRFDVAVIGHLREEKDSMRAAMAVRDLPEASRLNVIQLGRAHDDEWRELAEQEDAANPRFHWKGEVPRWQVRRYMARVRLMVISSVMEGGANVVSEACVAGLPVIASDIPGNIGLLGPDYPGYYRVRDTQDLRRLLLCAEGDRDFLERLRVHCEARAPLFTTESEQRALDRVVNAACRQYG